MQVAPCNSESRKPFNCSIMVRNLQHELSVSADTESEQDYLNQPNIKFQPHGHLTLADEQNMEKLIKDHEMQKVPSLELNSNSQHWLQL